ncbi:MAG: glycosyltransferase [Saccharospirillum sp.]|nr:glycosyltransferase [Saccharospirillum sp.]
MDEASTQLKVVHVVSGDLWAGAEVQTYNLLRQLATQCQVYAVVLNHGALADKLTEAGIETRVLDETQLGAPMLLRQLIAVFRQTQPNVIHTHRIKENILGSLAGRLARLRSAPRYIKTVHGAREHAESLKSRLLQGLERLLTKLNNTKIISVSSELQPTIAAQNPGNRVSVIENGVDQQSIVHQAAIGSTTHPHPPGIHVGFIGRLVPVKRVDIFLRAIPSVIEGSDEPYHFHIVGDGPLLSNLQQLAAELSIEDRVTFHGHRSDIPAFMASVDVVILCSEHEGTPMTVLEAISMNRKLVLHDTGGLTSVARLHGITPYSPNTPEVLANAIWSAQSPALLHDVYTIERCASKTLKFYMDE